MSEEIRKLLRSMRKGRKDARFADVEPAEQQPASVDSQKKNLRRFTKALRDGRDERRETHSILKHYLSEALPVETVHDVQMFWRSQIKQGRGTCSL